MGNLPPRLSLGRTFSLHPNRRSPRIIAEPLEERRLLSTVVVNTPLDGIFSGPSGKVSLRMAIATANASTTSQTLITFDPKVFANPQTITLDGTALEIGTNAFGCTIVGPAAALTINANNKSAAFQIDPGVAAKIENLTVTGGNESGVLSHGVLTLQNVTVTHNLAVSGGGIYADAALYLTDCVVSDNTATVSGGGIETTTNSTLNMTDVTVDGNTALSGGGGLYSDAETTTLTGCTISNNSAPGSYGGGMQATGDCNLLNCTIAGNSAYAGGGANFPDGCTAVQTTISANKATTYGGGVYSLEGLPQFFNSIIAGNTLTNAPSDANGPDVYGKVASPGGNNLVGITDGSSLWGTNNLLGTAAHPINPKLGPLANNGGPTLTMLPLAGSPAIGAGLVADVPYMDTTDQRGLPRIVFGKVDIGSVEVQQQPATISGVVFSDTNANGKQDAGEPGLAGVVVYIDANNNGKLDAGERKTTTSSAGAFSFTGLAPATYRIREVLPAGYVLTAPKSAGFVIPVSSGQITASNAFADAPADASISGVVFNDVNGDGKQDNGELGLGLWKVYLDLKKDGIFVASDPSVVTDINGNWSFTGLTAGTWEVRIVPVAGTVATTPVELTITIKAGQKSLGNVFGEKQIG